MNIPPASYIASRKYTRAGAERPSKPQSLLLFLIISAVRCHQRQQLQEPYMMNICVRVVRQAGSQGAREVAR